MLCGQSAYQTSQPNLERLRVTNTSARSPVFEPKDESPTSQSPTQRPLPPSHASHSTSIQVDPHRILPEVVRANFQSLLSEYDSVFDPHFPGYNGSTGPYQAKVNMGPVEPPQWNGRLPQYACDKLIELQEKFDHPEQLGVFQHQDVGITVEYVNPSFLVKSRTAVLVLSLPLLT